jgi:hypothetical protein
MKNNDYNIKINTLTSELDQIVINNKNVVYE